MNDYKAPQPRKFTPSQETQHREHEARLDYVAEHRADFLKLFALASDQTIKEAVEECGEWAHLRGLSFGEPSAPLKGVASSAR